MATFANPPPRFPSFDCPVIWEWTISNTRSEQHQLIARAVVVPLPEKMSHGNGDDAVDGDDIYRAEESDSGSEEVFGSRTVIRTR